MGFKSDSYKVESIDMQGKVKARQSFKTRTGAESFGLIELRNAKTKLIKINGKIWKVKGQK